MFGRVLNMPRFLILNIPVYQGSEYAGVTQGSEYAWICQNMLAFVLFPYCYPLSPLTRGY